MLGGCSVAMASQAGTSNRKATSNLGVVFMEIDNFNVAPLSNQEWMPFKIPGE